MPENRGPWDVEEPEPPPKPPSLGRRVAWLAVIALLGGSLWLLSRAFPGSLQSVEDWGAVIFWSTLILILARTLLVPGRIAWAEKARHAAAWIGVVLALVLAFAYQDELRGVLQRVRAEFSSSYPVASGAHELVVAQGEGGGFFITGQVNGQTVRFLIDTGSSDTVLSPADAQRIGVNIAGLRFDHMAETANGTGYGAPFVADSLTVGPIRRSGFRMMVNQAPMTSSLLGMSFLGGLESFQVRGRRLYLTWRD